MLRRFRSAAVLSFAIAALPEFAYAHGDPAILYWFAAALLLDVLCLVAILRRPTKRRAYVVAIFLAACTLLWTVILTNRTLSLHVAGAILTVFPIFYFGLVTSMANRNP